MIVYIAEKPDIASAIASHLWSDYASYKNKHCFQKGDVVVVLEAMKMENEIYASASGVVATVNVSAGDMVEGGDVLATIN